MSLNYFIGMDVSFAFGNKNNQMVLEVGSTKYVPTIEKHKKGLFFNQMNDTFIYTDGSNDYGEEVVELLIGQKFSGEMQTKKVWFRTKRIELYNEANF